MKVRPLWDIVKKTLTYKQNLIQFSLFLKENGRKHHHLHSINFQMMFLRVAVLMMFYQAEFITVYWWMSLYFIFKVYGVFNVTFEKQQAMEVVAMLLAFHLLDYLTKFIPFMNLLYWYVNVNYFLFGIQQKYLSLNIMLLPMNWINKSIIIIILGLGKVKKAQKYSRAITYIDTFLILIVGKPVQALWFLILTLLVEVIKIMDSRMIYTKKNYTHIDEIPMIEQYH